MKYVHGWIVGLSTLLFASVAMAEGAASEMETRSSGQQASVQAPDLSNSYKSSDLRGMAVKNQQGEDLGSISELLVDKDGKVSNVVLSEGGVAGIGGHRYIVPWDRVQLSMAKNEAIIEVSKDALPSEFAAFEEDKTPTAGSAEKSKSESKSDSESQGSGME